MPRPVSVNRLTVRTGATARKTDRFSLALRRAEGRTCQFRPRGRNRGLVVPPDTQWPACAKWSTCDHCPPMRSGQAVLGYNSYLKWELERVTGRRARVGSGVWASCRTGVRSPEDRSSQTLLRITSTTLIRQPNAVASDLSSKSDDYLRNFSWHASQVFTSLSSPAVAWA